MIGSIGWGKCDMTNGIYSMLGAETKIDVILLHDVPYKS
jgi:hypothetical protein